MDLVSTADTYHRFEHPQAMLAPIHRSLRPGGGLVVIDFEPTPGLSSPCILAHVRAGKQTVSRAIETDGFTVVEAFPSLRYKYMTRFQRYGSPIAHHEAACAGMAVSRTSLSLSLL